MMDKKKILIIEDEKPIVDVLVKKITEAGFYAISANDGKEGLEKAFGENPDLVLLDIVLPVMDGMTLLTKLREDERGKNIPVIILTNLDSGDKVEECRKKGVYDYLVKTEWSLEEVVEKIKKALS